MQVSDVFDSFHSKILPSDATLRNASERANVVIRLLENDDELRPKKVLFSGSYAKHTHLHPLNDIDVVAHYPINDWVTARGDVYSPGYVIGRLFGRMERAYSHVLTVRRQRRSVGLIYKDVKVDLIPALWEMGGDLTSVIPDRETGGWLRTCIPRHLEFLDRRDKTYRPFAKTIRLMKAWKKAKSIRFPGFALELLTVKALDKTGTSAQLQVNVANVMNFIADTRLDKPVYFTDFWKASDIRIPQHPVVVIDPVNPQNNVASEVTEAEKQRFLEKFDKDFKLVCWAIDAEQRGERETALKWWRAVFRDQFPAQPAKRAPSAWWNPFN